MSEEDIAKERRELNHEMVTCQKEVYKDLHSLSRDVHKVSDRVTSLEYGHREVKATLIDHEQQRIAYHKVLEEKIDQTHEMFVKHDQNEAVNYEEVMQVLTLLSDKTDVNTDFIATAKKYWIRTSLIVSTILATLGFVYWIYTFLEKHGFVFVIEKGVQ